MSRGREVKIKKLDIAIEGDRARASCQFELRATIEMEGVSAPINLYRAIEDGGESMTPFELAKKSRQMPADLAEFEWRRSGDGWLLEQIRYPEMGKWLNRYWDGGLE